MNRLSKPDAGMEKKKTLTLDALIMFGTFDVKYYFLFTTKRPHFSAYKNFNARIKSLIHVVNWRVKVLEISCTSRVVTQKQILNLMDFNILYFDD